jgi:hypothetical protein
MRNFVIYNIKTIINDVIVPVIKTNHAQITNRFIASDLLLFWPNSQH